MLIVAPSNRGLIKVPIDGAGSDIQSGAMVMQGVTEAGSTADNYGCAVLADETAVDALGVLVALHDYSAVGDSETYSGTSHVMAEIDPFSPGCVVAIEYDLTDTMAVATVTGTTQITITSIEDHLSGGWLYAYSGTGIGQLAFIKYDDATDLWLKSALTTLWVAADTTLVKIPPLFHPLHNLIANMTKFGTDAAAGTFRARIISNQFKYDGQEGWIDLDPGLHHNMQLNGLHPVFRSLVIPTNTFFSPVD